MENTSKNSKPVLYLSILSFIIFTGSYIVKIAVMNQFFVAETMNLKSVYIGKDLDLVLNILLPIFSICLISFIGFIVLYVSYILLSGISLKNEGWLFIITLILLITSPLEIYLVIKYDLDIIQYIFNRSNADLVLDLIKNRIMVLGPFPLVLLFSYFIIIFLALFKPLRKN